MATFLGMAFLFFISLRYSIKRNFAIDNNCLRSLTALAIGRPGFLGYQQSQFRTTFLVLSRPEQLLFDIFIDIIQN